MPKLALTPLFRTLLLFLVLCTGLTVSAQNFPIRASVTIIQPSPYLEEYGRDGNMLVVLTNVDSDNPTYQGLLRIIIQGNGYRAETRDLLAMPPVPLNFGQPLILRGADLAPYLNLNNLATEGIAIDNTLSNGGALPDGPITICVEVYNVNRFTDPPESNPACATRFVQQHYPPELVSPLDERPFLPVVNFTWNPRHVPQPANDEYELDIWEKVPGLTPDQTINSSSPVTPTITTPVQRYIFTNYDGRLEADKSYIWRVRVRDRRNVRTFINDGYSQPGEFYFGEDPNAPGCPELETFYSTGTTANNAGLVWTLTDTTGITGYDLRYQVSGTESWATTSLPGSNLPTTTLSELIAGADYEAELCATCTNGSTSCQETTFSTPMQDSDCGPLPYPTVIPVSENEITLSWETSDAVAGYRLYFSEIIIPSSPSQEETSPIRQREQAQGNELPGETLPGTGAPSPSFYSVSSDSLFFSSGTSSTEINGLVVGTDYLFRFCQLCPDGTQTCYEWTVDFNGVDDGCLTSLNFTRTDSTDTTLDLAWTYDLADVSATDSFTLIWQAADGGPESSATIAYASAAYTVSSLAPGQTYTFRVCAECTDEQTTCRDLSPFGGCVSEYLPELVKLEDKRALLGWPVDNPPAVTTEVRYAMRSFLNWENLSSGELDYFNPEEHPFSGDQLAETPRLSTSLVYLGQVRTQCHDTLWSAWSEPVEFSTGCSVVNPLEAVAITDESAAILAVARANASYYQFYYRPRNTAENEWTLLDTLPGPAAELNNLLADTDYEVKMRYWCNLGVWSDYTDVLGFRTLPPCGFPEDAAATELFADAARLGWTLGANAQLTSLQYRQVLLSDQPTEAPGEWLVVENLTDNTFLQNLDGGVRYEFQLQSDCDVNLSEWTPIDDFTLLCAPPSQLSVSDITPFTALATIGGLSPTAGTHEYSYRLLGNSDWTAITSATPTATLDELNDLSTYELRVGTSCNTGQFSVWSDTFQFTTLVDCRAPSNLGVTDMATNSANIRWDVTGTVAQWEVRLWVPTEQQQESTTAIIGNQDLDADILGSENSNTVPPDPYASWQTFTTTDPERFFTGLEHGLVYKIVVRAECPTYGWTEFSEVLEFSPLCSQPVVSTTSVPNIGFTEATLNWGTLGSCILDYKVVLESLLPYLPASSTQANGGIIPSTGDLNLGDNESSISEIIHRDSMTVTDRSALFSGLRANTEYRFRVAGRFKKSVFDSGPNGYLTMADGPFDVFGENAGEDYVIGEPGEGAYSEWFVFRTDHCAEPYDIVETTIDRSTMELSWTASNGLNTFEVKHKLAEDAGSVWATQIVEEPVVLLENLLSNAIYDYQVTEVCGDGETFRPAPQDTFLMEKPSRNNGLYVCGMLPDVDLSNEIPLAILLKDDTIRAFDFPVVILEVSGGNGYFSGVGEIRVPFFNKAKMQFEFDNIFVNDEYQMVGGYMEATGFGVEVLPPWADSLLVQIINVLEYVEDRITDAQLELMQDMMALGANANIPPALQQQIQDVLDCFESAETQAEIDACTTLLDNVALQVDSYLNTIYDGDFQVTFEEDPAQKYGFDGKQDSEPADWYQEKTISGENYLIPFKSVLAGSPETVKAIVPAGKIDSVAFSQPSGSSLGFSPNETSTTETIVNFRGQGSNDYFLVAEKIAGATTSPKVVGMTKVVPYPELPLHVTLVPVGFNPGLSEATIAAQLKDIFGQAVVNPIVEIDPVFNPAGYEGLSAVSSGLLTNYSPEMRDIIAAYETARDPDENTSYLFLINDFAPTDRAGFMPRGRQFGFIYHSNAGSGPAYARTLAHELGHGAYVLEHTWEANPSQPEGSTDNLMDYGTGDRLYKWQWDLIHSPVGAPLLPSDEDGEYVTVMARSIFANETTTHNGVKYLTFLNSYGGHVHLEFDSIVNLVFATGGESYLSDDTNGLDFIPVGTLVYFTLLDGEDGQSVYTGCAGGLYYKNLTPGITCNGFESIYDNPDLTGTTKPLLCRHAYKNRNHYLHYVPGPEELPVSSQTLQSFDKWVGYFYDLDNGGVRYPGHMRGINSNRAFLSPEFDSGLFTEFVSGSEYASIVDYNNVGNFYLSGFAVILEQIQQQASICNTARTLVDRLGLVRANAIWAIGTADAVSTSINLPDGIGTSEISQVEKILAYVYDAGYFQDEALSITDVSKALLSIAYQNAKVNSYNNRIAAIAGDIDKVSEMDDIIEDMLDEDDYLLPCEVDAISFPDYVTLQFFIKRLFVNTSFSGKAFNYYWAEGITTDQEEWFLLKFMRKVSPPDYINFLRFMESEIEYAGFSKHYWEELVEAIEDGMFSQNGKELIDFMVKVWKSVATSEAESTYKTSYETIKVNVAKVEQISEIGGLSLSETSIADLRVISYNYTGILNRVNWRNSLCKSSYQLWRWCDWDKSIFPATEITSISIDDVGRMNVYQRNKYLLLYADDPEDLVDNIGPFESFVLDSKSTFADAGRLQTYGDGGYVVLPAIALYYLEENATNQTTDDVAFTALDIATIALPIPKVGLIARVLARADKASSVLGIAASYAAGDQSIDPTVKNALNITSAFLGLVTLSENQWKNLDQNNLGGSLDRAYNMSSIGAQSEVATRYNNLMDHILADGSDWTEAAHAGDKLKFRATKELMADALRTNIDAMASELGPDARRKMQLAIDALQLGNVSNAERIIREALSNSHQITESRLPALVVSQLSETQANKLAALLSDANHKDQLLIFHELAEQTTQQSNVITIWNSLEQADVFTDANDFARITATISSDLTSNYRPNLLGWLEDNLLRKGIYKRLSDLADGLDKKTADWFRQLWLKENPSLSIVTDGPDRTVVKYNNDDIALIEGNRVDTESYASNYGSQQSGSEVLEVADDGKRAIKCRGTTCACEVCTTCFVKGTLVSTEHGNQEISTIKKGTMVASYQHSMMDTIMAKVTNTYTSFRSGFTRLIAGTDTIVTTNEHPFYVPKLGRYLRADSLRRGLQLLTLTGTLLAVTEVSTLSERQEVFNFSVEAQQNYFVGKQGVLVHNLNAINCQKWFDVIGATKSSSSLRALESVLTDNSSRDAFASFIRGAYRKKNSGGLVFLKFFRSAANQPSIYVARVKAWDILRNSNTPRISRKISNLTYVSRVLSNSEMSTWGFTRTNFAKMIQALDLRVAHSTNSLAASKFDTELFKGIYDFMQELTSSRHSNTIVQAEESGNHPIITELTSRGANGAKQQGSLFTMQSFIDDSGELANKTLLYEHEVSISPFSDASKGKVDLLVVESINDNDDLVGSFIYFEYKYGTGSFQKRHFSREFIYRDMFNLRSFSSNEVRNNFRWKLKDIDRSQIKQLVKKWLKDATDKEFEEFRTADGKSAYQMFAEYEFNLLDNGEISNAVGIETGMDLRLSLDNNAEWFDIWFDEIFKFTP